MEVLSANTHKAKKEHVCDYCWQKINIGEKYEYAFIVDSGDKWGWKNHLSCKVLVDVLNMHDSMNDGVGADDFQDSVSEKYYELTGISKAKFTEKIKYVKEHYKL